MSLIKQLFRSLVNKVKLGDYWRSVWKKYGYGRHKLSQEQLARIVKAFGKDNLSTKDIASHRTYPSGEFSK